MTTSRCYVALVHYPVKSKDGQVITTSITNLDVHDIARSARSFNLARYYLVSPVEAQRALVDHITGYWRDGEGAERVPQRSEALRQVEAVASLEDAIADITKREQKSPLLVTTAARSSRAVSSFADGKRQIDAHDGPALIVFGTGYGLTDAMLERANVHLAPIRPGVYNHLSVRAAAAIVFDRLFGDAGATG
ncbi:MAG: RNA methyltransferase [Deltaproteobacteria bacterium]|nr:RNA methyltransferase [Deltaproteobacteria bacterium]